MPGLTPMPLRYLKAAEIKRRFEAATASKGGPRGLAEQVLVTLFAAPCEASAELSSLLTLCEACRPVKGSRTMASRADGRGPLPAAWNRSAGRERR